MKAFFGGFTGNERLLKVGACRGVYSEWRKFCAGPCRLARESKVRYLKHECSFSCYGYFYYYSKASSLGSSGF